MKRLFLVCTVIVLFLFLSCSAEMIMSAGKTMGSLSSSGLGSAGKENVKNAVNNVEQITLTYDSLFLNEDESGQNLDAVIRLDNPQGYIENVRKAVNVILTASESGKGEKELREAFARKYEGTTSSHGVHYTIGQILDKVDIYAENSNFAEDGGSEPAVLLLGMLKLLPAMLPSSESVYMYELPFPLQVFDFEIMIHSLFLPYGSFEKSMQSGELINDVLFLYKNLEKKEDGENPDSGSNSGLTGVLNKLVDIVKQIGRKTEKRDYQTAGDKIALSIVADMLARTVSVVHDYGKYNTGEDDGNADAVPPFSGKLVLEQYNSDLRAIISDFVAVAYIYDVNVSLAGLMEPLL